MGLSKWVSPRTVLWHLVFWGFAVNYMIRINLNIAIVAMVAPRRSDDTVKVSECFVADYNNDNNTNVTHVRKVREFLPWDEYQQSQVLGAFFWLHWVLQVPGGILARKFGTKLVFGLGNLINCFLCMLVPAASYLDYRALIVLRLLQGLLGGVCWPAMHNMAASWIPPDDRSKFVTSYLGSAVGAGLTYPFCGLLIDRFDWPAAFYVTGLIGMGWFVVWWYMVYDSPAQHPHIDPAERQYIEDSLGQTVLKEKPPVPWRDILTSGPMWFTCVAQFSILWGMFSLLIHAPTYFRFIHGWDIRMTGLLSGIPQFCRIFFALVLSIISDSLLKRNMVRRVTVRKFATFIGTFGQGLFILGLAFCGCNWMAAIVCVTLATMMNGASTTGPLAIYVDLSPNFASITLGITNMFGIIPGFLSPVLIGALTYENQTIGQWQKVFLISSVIVAVPGLLFACFASPVLQPWNNPKETGRELKSPAGHRDTKTGEETQEKLLGSEMRGAV